MRPRQDGLYRDIERTTKKIPLQSHAALREVGPTPSRIRLPDPVIPPRTAEPPPAAPSLCPAACRRSQPPELRPVCHGEHHPLTPLQSCTGQQAPPPTEAQSTAGDSGRATKSESGGHPMALTRARSPLSTSYCRGNTEASGGRKLQARQIRGRVVEKPTTVGVRSETGCSTQFRAFFCLQMRMGLLTIASEKFCGRMRPARWRPQWGGRGRQIRRCRIFLNLCVFAAKYEEGEQLVAPRPHG